MIAETAPGVEGLGMGPVEPLPAVFWFYAGLLVAGVIALVLVWRPLQARSALWERRVGYIVRRPFMWTDLALLVCTLFVLYPAGALLTQMGGGSELDSMSLQVLIQSVTFHWAIFVMLFVLLRAKDVRWERAFGLYRGRARRDALLGVTGYLAMMPVVLVYGMISWILLNSLGVEQDAQDVAKALAADGPLPVRVYKFLHGAVVAPITEELLFRGVAFPLLSRRFGSLTGLILVSAVFAGIHAHLPSLLPLFMLSAILCMAYVHTGSIRVPIVMHMLFNAVNLTVHILASR